MQQVLFRLPIGQNGWPVYGFGAMLFCAFVACIWMATRRARKVGIAPEVIQDLALWIFGGGILGARIAYLLVFNPPPNFGAFLAALPRIWDGGIILYGSLIGAGFCYFVGFYLSFRHKTNVTALRLLDVIAPTVAVGLLLGRFGCFFNGCCYGQVACASCPGMGFPLSAPARYELTSAGLQTAAGFLIDESGKSRVTHVQPGSAADLGGLKARDLLMSINGQEVKSHLDVSRILVGNWPRGENDLQLTVERTVEEKVEETTLTVRPVTLPLQPTQLYESFSMALVLLMLLAFDRVKRNDGQGLALLMICYGIHRYVNEKLRIDVRPVGFESYISVALVVVGIVLMTWLARRPRSPEPVAA